MLPESLDQVLREQEIRAFLDPQLEVLNLEPVSFKATIALEPQIELGEFRSIRLQSPAVEIGPADINRVLERLQYESAPWEPADRPAAFGDLLTLSIHGAIDGQDVINHESVDYIPNMDNPHPLPGFSVYLEGMTEGPGQRIHPPRTPGIRPRRRPRQRMPFPRRHHRRQRKAPPRTRRRIRQRRPGRLREHRRPDRTHPPPPDPRSRNRRPPANWSATAWRKSKN